MIVTFREEEKKANEKACAIFFIWVHKYRIPCNVRFIRHSHLPHGNLSTHDSTLHISPLDILFLFCTARILWPFARSQIPNIATWLWRHSDKTRRKWNRYSVYCYSALKPLTFASNKQKNEGGLKTNLNYIRLNQTSLGSRCLPSRGPIAARGATRLCTLADFTAFALNVLHHHYVTAP